MADRRGVVRPEGAEEGEALKTIFIVPGEPGFKRRARAFVHNVLNVVKVAQPKENASYEAKVATFARAAGLVPVVGPVVLGITAYYTLPRSKHRRRKPCVRQAKTTKPDWDNIGKIVSDSLNGVAYLDDAQVCRATVTKAWAAQGEAGFLEVEVEQA